jgi:hypothetical protein
MAHPSPTERASQALVDAAEALRLNVHLDRTGGSSGLGAVLTADEVRRALVDVKTSDVGGILPHRQIVPPPVPRRPLFAAAQVLEASGPVTAPAITALPGAVADPAEKSDITTGSAVFPIPAAAVTTHTVAAPLGDLSAAVLNRSAPAYLDFLASVGRAALKAKLAGLICTDLTAAAPLAADLWTAYAAAAVGGPVTVLAAGAALEAVHAAFGPAGLISSGAVTVVPVTTTAFGALVVASWALVVATSDVLRLEQTNPDRLGIDVALVEFGYGAVTAPLFSAHTAP